MQILGDDRSHELGAEKHRCRDRETTAWRALHAGDGLVRLGELGEDGAAVLGVACTGFGDAHDAGGTGQEPDTEVRLQLVDRPCDRRWRDLQLARRACEAVGVDDSDEDVDEVKSVQRRP